MTRFLIVFIAVTWASAVDAAPRRGAMHAECNVTMPCIAPYASTAEEARITRGRYIARQLGIGGPNIKRPRRASGAMLVGASRSTAGVVAPLAAKAAEIQAACGSKVVSGIRHTRIAGTRRMSLHASGHAVDMAGNPACIYSHLQGWPGGYSTDYGRMRHVHISWGGPEHGLRFAHGGKRHARHRGSRYAAAR